MSYEKFQTFYEDCMGAFVGRHEEIECVLTAILCRQHCLFVGAPGTGKTMLADAVGAWVDGNVFSVLLTRFSTPEELVGPISAKGLKEDVYRRNITGKLPEAHIALLDEVFRGSPAVLNVILKVLNERTFQNDGVLVRCPLLTAIGGSNEFPQDKQELGAFFDRFLIRKKVMPVSGTKDLHDLLWKEHVVRLRGKITLAEISDSADAALDLPFSDDAQSALMEIILCLRKEGILVGDRRMIWAKRTCQASAWLRGSESVEPENMAILEHVLWVDPVDQPKKCAEIIRQVANPPSMQVGSLLADANEILEKIDPLDIKAAAVACASMKEIAKRLRKIGTPLALRGVDEILLSLEGVNARAVATLTGRFDDV